MLLEFGRGRREVGGMSLEPAASIAVVGAGPRGVGFLERIAANLPGAQHRGRVVVHLLDPHPPGAGRIWRSAQSPLLRLNSMAADVTMFTDDSSTIEGPVRRGPSLIEWAEGVRSGTIALDAASRAAVDADAALAEEVETLTGASFPTRRLQSAYLDWFFRRAVEALERAGGSVVVHEATVDRVDDLPDGSQRVHLERAASAGRELLDVDVVLYALGHTGSDPEDEHAGLEAFARDNDLFYLPPAYTADADTSGIRPGEDVIVRGMGLAAVDLVVLLTEGRGGRFARADDGELEYRSSGEEPHLLLGSRRGVPYRSKISSSLVAPRLPPRFFSAEIAARLEAGRERLSFRRDVWPLIAAELQWGYYSELFRGHPERVRVGWGAFAPFLERYRWNSSHLRAAVAAAVPDPVDRLDLEALDRPFAGVRTGSAAELQAIVREHLRTDLLLRSAPEHSATLGLFTSLLYALFDLGTIIDSPKWTARSRVEELGPWWLNYFSYIASGPPPRRIEELLALSRAGIVEFLGAGTRVRAVDGRFEASSDSRPDAVVARALVDARLPATSVAASDCAALRSLIETGAGVEELVSDHEFSGSTGRLVVDRADSRIVSAAGDAHPARFAIGPFTSAPFVGAFSRPNTNAVSFRENDRVARAVLEHVAVITRERPPSIPGHEPVLAGAPGAARP